MNKYSFYRKKVTPLQMLRLIIKSWFTSPRMELGCLFTLIFMPFYFITIFLQIALFLFVLPIIILVYLPLSLYLYRKLERTWIFWMTSYMICATLISIPVAFVMQQAETLFFLGAFIILSGLCGMFINLNLYTSDNMEVLKEGKND